jgi:hypothetical protein
MNAWLVGAATALAWVAGCGGKAPSPASPASPDARAPAARSASGPAASGTAAPALEPVEIAVRSKRMGGSIRFDITGIGRNRHQGHPIEDAALWNVTAQDDAGTPLPRVVNGSVRVARNPVGPPSGDRWDIIVTFSVAFTLPDTAKAVEVRVEAPNAPPVTRRIEDLTDTDPAKAKSKARSKSPASKARSKSPASKSRPSAEPARRSSTPRSKGDQSAADASQPESNARSKSRKDK